MAESHTHKDMFFTSGDVRLASTLSLPGHSGPHPAVILLSGSGAQDRDETVCGHKPFARISSFLTSRGHAVLRFDDRGVGGSGGDAALTSFTDSVSDAEAAFCSLAACPDIDPARICLFGHSEGGLVAAEAAARLPAHALVLLGTPALPIEEVLHGQAYALSAEAGATPEVLAHERRMNAAVFAVARGPAPADVALAEAAAIIGQHLCSWPGLPPMGDEELATTARQMAEVVCAPDYRSLLRQSPPALMASIRQPVLAVFGGKDCQVPGKQNLSAFRAATAGNARASALLFEEMNHLLQPAATGSISEYESLPPAPDDRVLSAIADWLASL